MPKPTSIDSKTPQLQKSSSEQIPCYSNFLTQNLNSQKDENSFVSWDTLSESLKSMSMSSKSLSKCSEKSSESDTVYFPTDLQPETEQKVVLSKEFWLLKVVLNMLFL